MEKENKMLKLDLEFNKGILFVRPSGKLNHNTSYKMNNYLVPLILKHKIKYLVYNLYELIDIDEAGMKAILNTKKAIKNNGGIVCVCEVKDSLLKKINKLHIQRLDNELSAIRKIEV